MVDIYEIVERLPESISARGRQPLFAMTVVSEFKDRNIKFAKVDVTGYIKSQTVKSVRNAASRTRSYLKKRPDLKVAVHYIDGMMYLENKDSSNSSD